MFHTLESCSVFGISEFSFTKCESGVAVLRVRFSAFWDQVRVGDRVGGHVFSSPVPISHLNVCPSQKSNAVREQPP